ncbi:hypothetical protein [Microseira wollei]|uniref:hypothetical protein n=1 Tax=Microseira wollei TaxID=467598 RepID=UPI001CFDAC6D|nr:hypothetical protein [Microseira wollei]
MGKPVGQGAAIVAAALGGRVQAAGDNDDGSNCPSIKRSLWNPRLKGKVETQCLDPSL